MLTRVLVRRLRLAAAIGAAVAVAGCTSSSGGGGLPRPAPGAVAVADHRPNVVFVLTDDLSTDLVRYMPHVQALAREGVSLSNYFVVDSLCCPSRASIFTGSYPHNTRVFLNTGPQGGYKGFQRAHDAGRTFAVSLHAAGYRTAFMGKYLNRYEPRRDPPARGWDQWDAAGSRGYFEYRYRLNENGHVHAYGSAPADYLTDVLAGKASDFVASSAALGKPFALEVATFAPHEPFVPAEIDKGTFPSLRAPRGPAFDRPPSGAPRWLAAMPPLSPADRAAIDRKYRLRVEAVQSVDRMIARLEQKLVAVHQLQNTYFVFSSDNGYHMGQYRLMPGKQTAMDTDIRVPLVVTGPGVPAGRTITAMASSIDLAPTFDAIAGAVPAEARDGVSLLPVLHGQPAPANWTRAVLVEHRGPDRQPGDPDRQPYRAGDPPTYEAMRTATELYVEYVDGDREYYDLRRDPAELHNIAATLSASRLASLHRTLAALAGCRGVTCQSAAAEAG